MHNLPDIAVEVAAAFAILLIILGGPAWFIFKEMRRWMPRRQS